MPVKSAFWEARIAAFRVQKGRTSQQMAGVGGWGVGRVVERIALYGNP